jgi:glycosyltransferase involved in cell wall biosynthesis
MAEEYLQVSQGEMAVRIAVVIPALNEEEAISRVVREVPDYVDEVIVVDNGSTDATAESAREAGARVVREERMGYGHACLAGVRAATSPDIIVFLDGDRSDYPQDMEHLLHPILRDGYDMVIGSRMKHREDGSMLPHAVAANYFFSFLMRLLYGVRFTDLGPFRAVKYRVLLDLGLREMRYGWTAEMQLRAVRKGYRVKEVDVRYRRRIGRSKVSGSPWASLRAALRIIYTIIAVRFT